jgi:hypothetical protein
LDFKVLVDPGKVAIGEPHKFSDLKWFTLDKLPDKELEILGEKGKEARDELDQTEIDKLHKKHGVK